MKRPLCAFAVSFAVAAALAQNVSAPGMAQEAAAPFSWYLVPSDEIGFKDCPQGFQITYDGAINNGFGELQLSIGKEHRLINNRVRTLYKGCYPMFSYRMADGPLQYTVETFGAPANLDPREDLAAFIRVAIQNRGSAPAPVLLNAVYAPRGKVARAELPCRPWYQSKFMNTAVFHEDTGCEDVEGGGVAKNGHLVFIADGRHAGTSRGEPSATYAMELLPGQIQTVDFKMPFVPIDLENKAEIAKIDAMEFNDAFNRVVRFWDGIYSRATSIEIDDPKVVDAMKTSLAYDLIARDVEADGKHFTQTVNKFQYHDFYMRDTSFIARSYEMMNLLDLARTTVEHYLVRDGSGKVVNFLHNMPDDWGQSLWALGSYLRASGDASFAKEILPAIAPHLDDFEKAVKSDPLGLWPVAGPYDNELVNGHYTSHNLWALLGLKEAENICRVAGDSAQAGRCQGLYAAFDKVFMKRLAALTAKDDGYIPPGMDDPLAGYDWENASGGVYPFGVLSPDHPWVKATVDMEREYKYREGIMTWGPNAWAGKVAAMEGKHFDPQFLHDYDTFQVTEALLAREEQRKVVEDLYSTLVHTSSTNGGFETSIRPWGNRDPDGNFPPHGWFAARYNELVRNMLVREVGDSLHLASALAPKWIEPGKRVRVSRADTNFGVIDYSIASKSNGADVEIRSKWRTAPTSLVFHIPWFVVATSARADGRRIAIRGGEIKVPASTIRLQIAWRWTEHPDLSYERAVSLWLHKAYEPKPGEDMDHLFATPTRPGLGIPQTQFADSYRLELFSRSGKGTVHYTLDGSEPTRKSPTFTAPVTLTKATIVKSIEVWPDGRTGDTLVVRIRKAQYLPPLKVGSAAPGLECQYYEGNWQSMPNFNRLLQPQPVVVPLADLDSIRHRPEQFAVRLTGFIKIPTQGIYTFLTGSDDGSKLWVGGKLVVDNDGPHPYKEEQGEVALRAGVYPVRIDYFDAGGANYLHVFWIVPGGQKEPVPASAWVH